MEDELKIYKDFFVGRIIKTHIPWRSYTEYHIVLDFYEKTTDHTLWFIGYNLTTKELEKEVQTSFDELDTLMENEKYRGKCLANDDKMETELV